MKKLILTSLILLTTSSVFAATSHIVTGSSSSSLQFSNSGNKNYEATLNVGLGYDYSFKNGLEFGGELSTIIGDFNLLTILLGPTFTFGSENINSSYLVSAKLGVATWGYTGFTDYTDTLMSVNFSKRFSLSEQISYVPGLRVDYIFNTDSDPVFTFEIFKFSLFF